jgi:hypothetical protein
LVARADLHSRRPASRRRTLEPIDPEVRELGSSARHTLREVISLWPADQRKRLVVWIRRDERGAPQIRARLRDPELDGPELAPELAFDLRRVRGDVPVVFELEGKTVVVPRGWLDASP